MDEFPRFEWIDTPADGPDMYAVRWNADEDDGRVFTIQTRFTGTVLATDQRHLPERVAEAARTRGRSEVERHLHAASVLESIEIREHFPTMPLLRFRGVDGIYV